jgi:hypothetical protein
MNKPRKITETNGAAYRRTRILKASDDRVRRAAQSLDAFVPRTKLGRRLARIRRRILAGGQPLLDWDDIASELRERRGEPTPEPGN